MPDVPPVVVASPPIKRRLFSFSAALSLLLSLAAAAGWTTSYARPAHWRLIATAHSDDLTQSNSERGSALFTTTPGFSQSPNYGFWDAWWVRSESGQLTLLAQVVDYEGTLRRVYATPPSLTVDPSTQARAQPVVVGRMPGSGPANTRLGFAFETRSADGSGGLLSARTWMVTLPWWFILLLGLPAPLLWLRARRRRSDLRISGT